MDTIKKKTFVAVLFIMIIGSVLITHSINKESPITLKMGIYTYPSSEMLGIQGASACSTSPYDFFIKDGEKCMVNGIEKTYSVKHSLVYGDVMVVDWHKDKNLRFRVISEDQMQALSTVGLIKKGDMLTFTDRSTYLNPQLACY